MSYVILSGLEADSNCPAKGCRSGHLYAHPPGVPEASDTCHFCGFNKKWRVGSDASALREWADRYDLWLFVYEANTERERLIIVIPSRRWSEYGPTVGADVTFDYNCGTGTWQDGFQQVT